MINVKLILGADIGMHTLTLSGCLENQKELIHETYSLEKDREEEELAEKIREFLNKNYPGTDVSYFIYSCENCSFSKRKELERFFRRIGIGREGIRLISRENAFVHYVMHQKEELHRHTVIAFDFDGNELIGYRLYYPNKKMKKEMKTEKKVIGSFGLNGSQQDLAKIFDQKFAEIAKMILSKEVISTVFLTGQGFEGGWLQKSLKVICDGRRAFFGQNLFSSGCCLYGMQLCKDVKNDYFIQAPETVLYESGVVDSGDDDSLFLITEAGMPWYETKGSIDVIMERGGRADIVFVHSQTKEKQVESVDISGLPPRPRKTGRLKISVEFFDNHSGVITVLDKGFGAFSPSTHQVFLKEFTLL